LVQEATQSGRIRLLRRFGCSLLGSDEWTRIKGNYRVRIRGVWFDIEDSQMLRPDGEPNPTGQAILWYRMTDFGFSIRCFTPQYES
jgi:hypothetical protein